MYGQRTGVGGDTLTTTTRFDTQDSLYDVAFSELHENQLAVASGDGSIKLFDTTLTELPVASWQEHTREVFSVNWNLVDKSTFCSASWDGSVKIVRPPPPAPRPPASC